MNTKNDETFDQLLRNFAAAAFVIGVITLGASLVTAIR